MLVGSSRDFVYYSFLNIKKLNKMIKLNNVANFIQLNHWDRNEKKN